METAARQEGGFIIATAYEASMTAGGRARLEEIDETLRDVAGIIESASDIVVIDDDTNAAAAVATSKIAKSKKRLEELRKFFVGPLNERVDLVNGFFKNRTTELLALDQNLRRGIEGYFMQQQEAKRAEERRLQAEQDAKSKAARKLGMAAPKPVETVVAEVPKTTRTDTGSVTVKMVWGFETIDLNKVSREYLMLDESKVRAAIKEGKREIPGLTISERPSTAAR